MHLKARLPELVDSTPGVPWIWIDRANHDSAHPCRHDGVGAWSRLPVRRTGLEGHVEDRVFRDRPIGVAQALDLCMGPASAFMMAFRDDLSINCEDRPDGRIGTRLAEAFARFPQSRAHQNLVVLRNSHIQRYLGSIIQANLLL